MNTEIKNILDEFVDYVNDTYYRVIIYTDNGGYVWVRTIELKTKHSNGRTE